MCYREPVTPASGGHAWAQVLKVPVLFSLACADAG